MERLALIPTLNRLLLEIEQADTNYALRYGLVFAAITHALACGFSAGIRLDPDEPEWPVAYIEMPTGQLSWHFPQHPIAWDGHSTEEKYRRIHEFVDGVNA